MKVNVEIDCTPLEARQFFGLPDVHSYTDLLYIKKKKIINSTGRLLAEMMTGETPFADARPFAVERFG